MGDGQWTLGYVRWGLGPHGPLGKEGRRGGPRTLGLFWAGQVGTSPQVWQERRRRGQKGKRARAAESKGQGEKGWKKQTKGDMMTVIRARSRRRCWLLSLYVSLFLFCISRQRQPGHASAAGGVGITGYVVLTPGARPRPSLSVPVGAPACGLSQWRDAYAWVSVSTMCAQPRQRQLNCRHHDASKRDGRLRESAKNLCHCRPRRMAAPRPVFHPSVGQKRGSGRTVRWCCTGLTRLDIPEIITRAEWRTLGDRYNSYRPCAHTEPLCFCSLGFLAHDLSRSLSYSAPWRARSDRLSGRKFE
ncbi:hypothetical protein EDB80DRAFT_133125 [Ilyonectria destructans]|nr:hypothetical protein EDB80DRAFT_133125 [Ilyonectria destructans]